MTQVTKDVMFMIYIVSIVYVTQKSDDRSLYSISNLWYDLKEIYYLFSQRKILILCKFIIMQNNCRIKEKYCLV